MSFATRVQDLSRRWLRGRPEGRSKRPAKTRLQVERLEARTLLTTNFTYEHIHLEPNFSNGAWQPFDVLDDTHGIVYDPSQVRFEIGSNALTTQPAGWTFIGAGNGNPYFHLDSEESDTLISIAVSTENILPHTFDSYKPHDPRVTATGEWIKLSLLNVTGPSGSPAPGFVSNWEDFQPPQFWWMSSYDGGRTLDPVFYIEPGDHVHLNWGFSAAGIYRVTFQASAFVGGSGLPLLSPPVTLAFQVSGSEPASPAASSDLVTAITGQASNLGHPLPTAGDVTMTTAPTAKAVAVDSAFNSTAVPEPVATFASLPVRVETPVPVDAWLPAADQTGNALGI